MATTVSDRLVVSISGQASKRGLIPRTPAGDRLLGDAATWLRTEYPEIVRSDRQASRPSGETELVVALHPAAPDLVLTAADGGDVTAVAETIQGGPGYHRFVGRVLERMGLELGVSWAPDPIAFAERSAVELAYLSWLGPRLAQARVARQHGRTAIHVGTPPGTSYTSDGAIVTPLGPRDDAWLEAAIAEPRVAIDVTPWWYDATDGRYLLNRALTLMWLEVRWRTPAVEGEAATHQEVHGLLTRAFPMDPDLSYPWHEWVEIASLLGVEDAMVRQAVSRATGMPAPVPAIGYRREPVRVSHEGWSLEVPGEYAERRSAEEWWGGCAGRSITLAATDTGTPFGPMSAEAFLREFADELGPDALNHRAGDVIGRARLTTDATSGVEVGVLEGFSAISGSGAAIRIVFDDPADWDWALEMWRSLEPT